MFVIAIGQSFMRCRLHSRRRCHETPNEIWKCNVKRQLVLICFWINCMRLGDFVQCTMENGVIHVIVLNVTSCVWCSCFAKRFGVCTTCTSIVDGIFHFPQCRKFGSVTDWILVINLTATQATQDNKAAKQRVINGLKHFVIHCGKSRKTLLNRKIEPDAIDIEVCTCFLSRFHSIARQTQANDMKKI